MLEALQKTINSRKTAYTALLEAASKLTNVIPNETQRIQAAFAMISGDGRTLNNVIQSLDVHIADLESERMRFKATSDKQVSERCGAKTLSATALRESIKASQAEIDQLTQRIGTLTAQIHENDLKAADLERQAAADESEIRTVEDRFNNTVEFAKSDLANKKQQLATVLAR